MEMLEKGEQLNKEQDSWWNKQNWKTIAWYGGGILFILLLVFWLFKKIRIFSASK
jgi:hypothetical protein